MRGFDLFGGAKIKSVQYGTVSLDTTPKDITISTIDLSKSFAVCTVRTTYNDVGSAMDIAARVPVVSFPDSSTLRLAPILYGDNTASWFVIEFLEGISVQRGITTIPGGSYTRDVTISDIDLSKSFILYSYSANTSTAGRALVTATFTSSTNIRFQREVQWDTVNIGYFVIQFN